MKLLSVAFVLFFSLVSLASPNPIVLVETNQGNFEIELYPDKAPLSVQNFLSYVDSGFYDNTIIHRVVKDFVVQAGGLLPDMSEKPGHAPIKNEANNGLSNLMGTVGMARTEEIDSATTHFFINLKDNVRLDYQNPEKFGYAVFGKVITGFEVVQKMESTNVQTIGEFDDVPVEPIWIQKVHRKAPR